MEYAVWRYDGLDDDLAWLSLKLPDEIDEKSHHLSFGKPAASWFPDNPILDLSVDHGIKLADAIPNAHGMLVVSSKLRSVLDNCGVPVETFPVRIRNQRGKTVSKQFYVANILHHIECLDKAKSDFVMSSICRDQVQYFRRCVLDESRIPDGTKLFRLQEDMQVIVISVPFAKEIIHEHGCEGIYFQYIEEYGSECRPPEDDDEEEDNN